MGKVTFDITTNPQSRVQIKKQIYDYCVEKDYGVHLDEKKGVAQSVIDVKIDVPDKEVPDVLKVFSVWGEFIKP
jgi:hypothetical protein